MVRIILYIFAYLTESYIIFRYTSCFFTPKYRTRSRILSLVCLYSLMALFAIMEIAWLNAVLFIVFNGIFLFSQYRLSFSQGILHLSILTALMAVSEIIVYSIVSQFAPNFYSAPNNNLAMVFFGIFSKLLYLLATYLLMLVTGKEKLTTNPDDHSALLLVLIPLASIFIIMTFITISEASYSILSTNSLMTISTFLLLLINLLVFGINQYNQKKSIEFTNLQILLQKESDLSKYYEMLSIHKENQGILIHDFKKHLQSISLLNRDYETDEIDSYINQLMLSFDLSDSLKICDNKLLNAILCRYQRQCFDNSLQFHVDVRRQCTEFLDNLSLTSLFCNLLDNALEAAIGIPNGYVEIMVQKKEGTPFVMINVINSCWKNPLTASGALQVSEKQNPMNHGFGMKSICRTVKQYQGDIKMHYEETSHTFHTVVTLRNIP